MGVVVSLPDDLEEGFTLELFFDLFGNMLQVIEIKGVDEELVNMLSEWSQDIAAILAWLNELQGDKS